MWRERVERQAASGWSIRRFCDQERISQATFYAWRKRLPDPAQRLDAIGDGFTGLVFTPDGTRLIGQFMRGPRRTPDSGNDFTLGLRDLHTGRLLQRLFGFGGICCSADGRYATCSDGLSAIRRIEPAAPGGANVPP